MIDLLADAATLNVLVEGLVTSRRAGTVTGALPRVMVGVDNDMGGGVEITVVAVTVSYVVDAVSDVMIGCVSDLTVDVLVDVGVKMLIVVSTPLIFLKVPSEEAMPFS